MEIGDVDPSYSMLRYLCDRFELNTEQRYWLAFLYSTCYCGPSVFYVYNEFPDLENSDPERMRRWWESNKSRMLFQTDRRWIRMNNEFVPTFESYRDALLGRSQESFYRLYKTDDPILNYRMLFDTFKNVKNMGRFTLFIYLEAVHVVTGFPMKPDTLDLRQADACLRGFNYAAQQLYGYGRGNKQWDKRSNLATGMQPWFELMAQNMEKEDPRNSIWNIETSLCAYGKYRAFDEGRNLNKMRRYIGYYIDRQADEINHLQNFVPEGVDWDVLWQYRRETFDNKYLKEITGHGNDKHPDYY